MRLEISQQQKQTISPVIMQTLELLTIPTIELTERLEEEAEVNPIVELEYKKDASDTAASVDEEIENKFQDSSDTGFDKPQKKDKVYSEYNNQAFIENIEDEESANLYNYLSEQIDFLPFSPREKEIAGIIITSLDDRGFLTQNLEDLAAGSDYTLDELELVRQRILYLDPIGVASRDLVEFLKIQTVVKFGKDSIEYRIVDEGLEYVEKKLYTKLAKKLGVAYDHIEKAIENIKTLNVVPTNEFSRETVKYIVPDAKVEVQDDRIKVTLNDEYIPKVKLNQYYVELYKGSKDKPTKSYLKENIDRAKILIENLESRKEIIFKVVMTIIEKQKDFFIKGEQYQVPLKLKDIADELNIHESTVSRAIKEKYIQTDRGIVSLKSFFSTTVGSEDVSANSIKETLKMIVEAEDKNDPLSDDKIVRILTNKGISVSRRTVAKYRSELNIPPVFVRRNPL